MLSLVSLAHRILCAEVSDSALQTGVRLPQHLTSGPRADAAQDRPSETSAGRVRRCCARHRGLESEPQRCAPPAAGSPQSSLTAACRWESLSSHLWSQESFPSLLNPTQPPAPDSAALGEAHLLGSDSAGLVKVSQFPVHIPKLTHRGFFPCPFYCQIIFCWRQP